MPPSLSQTMSRPASSRRPGPRSIQSYSSSIAEKQTPPPKANKPSSLARRLLYPQLPADADLPPILVSSSASPELNEELYNFIAIALRAYVHPWWTKITRYDKEFLPGIMRVLIPVIRTLETRLAHTDLSPLMLQDIPALLSTHYTDYRNAQAKLHTSYASGGAATLPQLFHQIQPHMALSADGRVDETYIRQALDDVLRVCLPEADYGPESERFIIREILVKVLLGGVVPRVTQPWFIHQSVLNLLGPETDKRLPEPTGTSEEGSPSSQRAQFQRTSSSHSLSFQSLAIFFLSAIRSISGACLTLIHAYKNARDTFRKVNQSTSVQSNTLEVEKATERPVDTLPGSLVPLSPMPPSATIPPIASPPSPPPSPPSVSRTTSSISSIPTVSTIPAALPSVSPSAPRNYVYPTLHLLHTIFTPPASPITPPRSTPSAFTHILTLLVTPFTSPLSRLLPYLLYNHAFSPESLLTMVQAARNALFPGGWPAVPPPDPTPEEQAELRLKLSNRLLGLVPGPLLVLLGTTPSARMQSMDAIIEPLSSSECNTHLLVFLLDLVLLTLFPEMGVSVPGTAHDLGGQGVSTSGGSTNSMLGGDLTPPRPDSRPP